MSIAPQHPQDRRAATLAGLGAIALWATLAPLSLFAKGVPPLLLTGAAFLLGGALGLLLQTLRGTDPRRCFKAPPVAWGLGVGGFFGYHFVYFSAFRHLPAIEALLIINLWPLLIVLFSSLATDEPLRPRHVLGALAGLAGASLLALGQPASGSVGRSAVGYSLALAAAVIWSGYSVLNRRFAAATPTEPVIGFCLVTGLLGLLCHLLIEPPASLDGPAFLAVLLLGIGPVGLAFALWDRGTKHGDLRVLGSASYAAPLIGTGLLIAMGEAAATLVTGVAGLLILGGAAWAARSPRPSGPGDAAADPAGRHRARSAR